MAHLTLFHHAQGVTPGVVAFADQLRVAGHQVSLPDLFEGRTFPTVEEGVAYVDGLGMDEIITRASGTEIAPGSWVAGMSLGVVAAHHAAQTRPGIRGAFFLFGCLPVGSFGPTWPEGVPVQIHAMEDDPWFAEDRDAALSFPGAACYLYPGSGHLFTEPSAVEYDPEATTLVLERIFDLIG